ncbi:hypothetical protein A2U01_0017648, partial [Trifolium medium]|nr:hypothetical protein [Trifolium medium]
LLGHFSNPVQNLERTVIYRVQFLTSSFFISLCPQLQWILALISNFSLDQILGDKTKPLLKPLDTTFPKVLHEAF